MSLPTPIRPKIFREQVYFRNLRARVDGNAKVEHGLTQIRGIGRRFAQAIVIAAKINPELRIGALPEKDLNKLEEMILDPINRMKKIQSYKGVRHHLKLKVRGQRTKSTGRHGLVVGVMRRRKRQQN